ncbi:MAG: lipoyl synthase [Candidatus Marinimicrobia bacterium]|nr:lipoyl synthase [Candidatus Neomarinimicrobiota bacterium]
MIKINEPPINSQNSFKKPEWLKVKLNTSSNYSEMKDLMKKNSLHTVCEEARCPNIYECWNNRTATVMILGDTCTRSCGFCSVKTGKPLPVDYNEPERVAKLVQNLDLRHVVITSVDRDELKNDYGAKIWNETIKSIRNMVPSCTIEVLTPDFRGYTPALDLVFNARPNIFSHNIECVERISLDVRRQSNWKRSLEVLKYAVSQKMSTKTGMMVGLGETDEEVYETMYLVAKTGVEIFNIGQYLQPTKSNLSVKRFVHPDTFKDYEKYGYELGFKVVESGPLVRSSYHADSQARDFGLESHP